MSSIIRPTPGQRTRRLVVLAAAVFSVAAPLILNFTGFGLSQAEFAAEGNTTLRVAGYAFSIWFLLYMGLMAYAIWQVLPQTGESDLINRMGLPSIAALFGIGLWLVIAALNLKAASVIIIFAALISLLAPLLAYSSTVRGLGRTDSDRTLVLWPLAALAGWLTVAAPLNLITVVTAFDGLPVVISPSGWAVIAIMATAAVVVAVTAVLRTLAYPLPAAWGLLGAFVAQQEDGRLIVAYAALAASAVVLVAGVLLTFRLRPGVER